MPERDANSSLERLLNMRDYILSPEAKYTVAKKMSGDSAELCVQSGRIDPVLDLLRSDNLVAQSVAASALDLMGPLACEAGADILRLLDHPDETTKRYGETLARDCGLTALRV